MRGFHINILNKLNLIEVFSGWRGVVACLQPKEHTVSLAPKKMFVLCCSTPQCHFKGFIKAWSQEYRKSMKVAIHSGLSFEGCFAIAAYAKGLKSPAGEARDIQQRLQTLL